MKILFDYSIFNHQELGGISRYVLNLDTEINKTSNVSKILAPIHYNLFLKNYKNYKGLYIKKFPKFISKLFEFYNKIITKKYISNFKPEIIHKTYFSNFWPENFKGKKIITVYDLIHEIYHKDYNFSSSYRPKAKSLSGVDAIITISHNTKLDLIKYYNIPSSKIFVTHLGINLQNQNSYIKIINEPYILYVGDRKRYKNFSNFLLAYANSSKINNNFKIVLFGGGKLFKSELEIISKYNINPKQIIQLSGSDSDLASLYKYANLFIFPSKYEGFGLPLLESASKGCPIACSDLKVFREIMDDTVQYFDPNSIESIKESLEKILFVESLKKDLVSKASKKISSFSWKKCGKETLEIYGKL